MDRFWKKVQYTPGCWLWTGAKCAGGYAQFMVRGKRMMVHRFAYELLVGPIQDGLELDHLCKIRNCVNPEHLESVTHHENTLRGDSFSGRFARQSACKRGHEFTPENTYIVPSTGSRQCRECVRMLRRKQYV